jgi:alpha-1,6-mannosyltransferase
MIDRVSKQVGRLGTIDDADTMARNILEVWNSNRFEMAERARAHALQFSWDRSMESLFGRVYPMAFGRCRGVPASRSAGAPVPA